MDLLRIDGTLPTIDGEPVLLVALDGWTDAGSGGSAAAQALREAFPPHRLGSFDGDRLYDYRDRRPQLDIDRGILGTLEWPELTVDLMAPPAGPPLVLVSGSEPDLAWQHLARDLAELAQQLDITRYVGLGSVPGPIPHTRPVTVVCTGTDGTLLDRMGRPHEQAIVPASFQVVLEKLLGDGGMDALGLWVRVPHYVAGEYPQASRALLERLSAHLGTPVDPTGFDEAVDDNRTRLDLAAASSEEVTEHVRQLERLYDAEVAAERVVENAGGREVAITEEDVPSADELAAEIERFLRGR